MRYDMRNWLKNILVSYKNEKEEIDMKKKNIGMCEVLAQSVSLFVSYLT
jgi:hypothetical protein